MDLILEVILKSFVFLALNYRAIVLGGILKGEIMVMDCTMIHISSFT